MTQEQVKTALAECFQQVIEPHLFEPDTDELRMQIVCEFVDECALLGHGVQAEALMDHESLKGITFLHENGYSGTITISAAINMDNTTQ